MSRLANKWYSFESIRLIRTRISAQLAKIGISYHLSNLLIRKGHSFQESQNCYITGNRCQLHNQLHKKQVLFLTGGGGGLIKGSVHYASVSPLKCSTLMLQFFH